MKKGFRVLTLMFAMVMVLSFALPMGMAFAEEPTHLSEVDGSAVGFGAPFQHHSFIDDGRQWVFYTNGSYLVYSTSTNMVTWSAPIAVHPCVDSIDPSGNWQIGDSYSGTQFDLWYDSTNNKLDIVVLPTSTNNTALLYARFTPSSSTGALTNVTAIDPWQPSLSGGGANVSMVLPSICVTPSQQPIIAVTRINASDTPAIDVGVIGFANPGTGTLMALAGSWPKYNLSQTGDASAFGSVIPLLSGNISVQFVEAEIGEGYLKQAIIGITGGADTLGTDYYVDSNATPSAPGFLWDYNAVSVHTDAVTASGNEDVMIVWNKDEGATSSLQFNRLADSTDWDGVPSYAIELADDDIYIGALGLRDTVGNLVYSAIGYSESDYLYSWDYGLGTATLSTVDVIDEAHGVQYAVMANYNRDLEGDQNTGFIYQGSGYEMMYGAYEPAAPVVPTSSTGVWTMAAILPYVFVGISLVMAVAMFSTSNAIGGMIMLAIAMVLTVVGAGLIQGFIP
jgi:hypothetical protein